MDSSGFGRAVAVPLAPRQGVVFGKAAAAGKPGAGTTGAKAGTATAGGKVAGGSGPGFGAGPSRQALKGARPGAQGFNAETEQNVYKRRPSPTRMRNAPPAGAHPPVKQSTVGAILSDAEMLREATAKAQRLLRFSQGQETPDIVPQPNITRGSGKADHRVPNRESRQLNQSPKPVGDSSQNDTMETDALGEDFNNTEAIVGTCEDMCSEIERHERERKGDLDKFERVDGDRNLTSADLAVKKYTRTPSREPHLIRPLPVLQMTMNYLLSLINQGYDEGLLRLHSFLWDRMRAVRMDLRMQHIFNREAITMHEQMIRFHILAMHELCQYKKGEGFNEGFDAHLNIEQMNKASVDLFEMYDDHRKRGIQVETEAEFRGYYALLKLDKHPGYSVEPAELSLDLAKMTPEMRNTRQVLFARDVASQNCRMAIEIG